MSHLLYQHVINISILKYLLSYLIYNRLHLPRKKEHNLQNELANYTLFFLTYHIQQPMKYTSNLPYQTIADSLSSKHTANAYSPTDVISLESIPSKYLLQLDFSSFQLIPVLSSECYSF